MLICVKENILRTSRISRIIFEHFANVFKHLTFCISAQNIQVFSKKTVIFKIRKSAFLTIFFIFFQKKCDQCFMTDRILFYLTYESGCPKSRFHL